MNQTRRARIRFFADHGTRADFRMIDAKSLADAEEWASANDLDTAWEHDADVDLSWADEETMAKIQGGEWVVESATLVDADGTPLGALCGIVGADPIYRRVIAAQLASEAMERPRAYRVTIVATVEADSAEEAQAITGRLLGGHGHQGPIPLAGPGSWAPEVKKVERIS